MATKTTARLALPRRPRRLRRTEAIRSLVRETRLTPDCFIYPLFICVG
jgi:porphobilinogen synthase